MHLNMYLHMGTLPKSNKAGLYSYADLGKMADKFHKFSHLINTKMGCIRGDYRGSVERLRGASREKNFKTSNLIY